MKIIFVLVLLMVFGYVVAEAGQLADCGNLPTWDDLHMTKKDYWQLMGLAGLISGSIFTFLITR